MEISIYAEAPKDSVKQFVDDGGVWLVVIYNDEEYMSYLTPSALLAWIEGGMISDYADFPGLPEIICREACRQLDTRLREIVQ